jgi:SH3-like domain-containing protein
MKARLSIPAATLILSCTVGCVPKPEPAIDRGTVIGRHASVRTKNSSTSKTLLTLEAGSPVDVLERHDNWYRVRVGDLQGFMEETTVLTDTTREHIQQLAEEARDAPVQNTARTTGDATLRMEPSRSSPAVRKLAAGVKLEILERRLSTQTERRQAWFKARVSPTEAGWISSSLVAFDVPEEISPYTEERVYTAVQVLKQVSDPVTGPVSWYVIGERSTRLEPGLDFDGIRVFTWNMKKGRYETAFRLNSLKGVYPLEVGAAGDSPTFRFYELTEDGGSKKARNFTMNGVVVREARKT